MQKPHLSVYKWRILPLVIAPQHYHMELSEQLLQGASPDEPAILYWSQAEGSGLVLGFSQKENILHPSVLSDQTIPLYRRRAGGTAVLVGPELLSLDVILPAGHPLILPDIVESYQWLGLAWVNTLGSLGIEARVVLPEEAHAQQALIKEDATRSRETILRRACFGSLSPYEVIAKGRKVVGLDMIRRRTGSLLQAGVLLSWNVDLLIEILGHTLEERAILREGLPERAIGLDILTGRPIAAGEVIAAFEEILKSMD